MANKTGSRDPTRTVALRNRLAKRIDARFLRLRKRVRRAIVKDNALGAIAILKPGFTGNASGGMRIAANIVPPEDYRKYNYEYDGQLYYEFMNNLKEWVKEELDLRRRKEYTKWFMGSFINQSYRRGMEMSRDEIRKNTPGSSDELPYSSPLLNPAHRIRAEQLATRTFNLMKNLDEGMRKDLREKLSHGIATGDHPYKIAETLDSRLQHAKNGGQSRAQLIARTEMIHAHQSASIEQVRQGNIFIGGADSDDPIKMKWSTKMDGRERPHHHELNGRILTIEEAEIEIGEPNCRCALIPWRESWQKTNRLPANGTKRIGSKVKKKKARI